MSRKAMDWDAILEEHRHSGKSIECFCREKGIHPNTFYRNRAKMNAGDDKESCVHQKVDMVRIDFLPKVEKTEAVRVFIGPYTVEIPGNADNSTIETTLRMLGILYVSEHGRISVLYKARFR